MRFLKKTFAASICFAVVGLPVMSPIEVQAQDRTTFEFKPISIQARQDVGAVKLAELQSTSKTVVEQSLAVQNIQENATTNTEGTASGTQDDLSYRIRQALQRTESLVSQNNIAPSTPATVVLPPLLDANNTPISGSSTVTATSGVGTTLSNLNIQHDGGLASKVVESALSQVGVPYVWGGESLAEGGFDCSGLMQWAYSQHGINITRTTYTQVSDGTAVPLSSIQPGDLVFYRSTQHVAMYIGDGKVVHAPYTGTTIAVDSLHMMSPEAVRRIV